MLSVPALLRRHKTCCWWVGGKASCTTSETERRKGCGSTRTTHGEHPEQHPQAGGAGMGTPALPPLPEELGAVAAVGSGILQLVHARDFGAAELSWSPAAIAAASGRGL